MPRRELRLNPPKPRETKEERVSRLKKNLNFEKYDYPNLDQELNSVESRLTIKCKKHGYTYTQTYRTHAINKSIMCPECLLEKHYNDLIVKINEVFPDGRYSVSLEDYKKSKVEAISRGVKRYTVRVHCNNHDVYFTGRRSSPYRWRCPNCMKEFNRKFIERTPELISQIKYWAEVDGLSKLAIAERLKISEPTVYRIIEENNISLKREEIFKNRERLIINGTKLGKSLKEISRESGEDYDALLGVAINRGLDYITFKIPEWRKELTIEEASRRLIDNRETASDIARSYGVKGYQILWHLDRIGFINVSKLNQSFREKLANKIKSLNDLGTDWKDICDELDISPYMINKISSEFGITLHKGCSSNGERIIKNYLNNNNFEFEYNPRNSDIVGRSDDKNSRGVFIDFIVVYNNQEYYIEFNGQQHFRYEEFFHRDYSRFQSQVQRDENVRKYCNDHDIILIEIPIFDYNTLESIESLLNKIIKEGINPKDIINIESYYERPINEILTGEIP